jgi:hypothetical protein
MSFQSRKQVEHGNNPIRSRANALTREDLGRLIDTAHARVSVFPVTSEAISYTTTNSEHQTDTGKQLFNRLSFWCFRVKRCLCYVCHGCLKHVFLLLAPTTAQPINIACINSGVNNVSLSLSSLISVHARGISEGVLYPLLTLAERVRLARTCRVLLSDLGKTGMIGLTLDTS